MNLTATRLDHSALDQLAAALAVAGLPISDLAEAGRTFLRFDDDDGLAGFGGIEGDGVDRLLRSLVVVPARRGAGVGRAMLAEIERTASRTGTARLHLLTTTAAGFFAAAGYDVAERGVAPPTIAASREFTSLCPSSAVYFIKTLDCRCRCAT